MEERARRPILAVVVGLFAAFALAASATAIDSGPAARWAFDETSGSTAEDAIGTLDGTIHGASHVADGFDDGAFRFDGADDVTIPSSAMLRTGDMALSLWVRADPETAPTPGQVIVDNGNVLCGGNGYALVATASWAKVVYRDAKTGVGIVTIQPAPSVVLPSLWDGNWHHLAVGAAAGDWGSVYLFMDGWHVASRGGGDDSSHGVDYGVSPSQPLVIGDDNGACGAGFVGDVDDVRLFAGLAQRDVLAGLEPEVQTSLSIDSVEPGAVQTDGNIVDRYDISVTLLPAPALPGSFSVYLTAEDGVERQVGGSMIDLGNLSADGHYGLGYFAPYGGDSSVRVTYTPEVPGLPSEDSHDVEIAKAGSSTYVVFDSVVLDTDQITVGVSIHPSARVPATGTVELWEVTGAPVLLGEEDVFNSPGTWQGSAVFDLAARPAGDYTFLAKYSGSAANEPSDSLPTVLSVLPGLVPGEVSINSGDATTDDPIVTVSAPATGAIAWLITTDPNDIRRQFQLPYDETFTTWLTQPWYGDDADGVRTIWVKWADAKSHWSEWATDTIVLDRGPAGTATIDGGAGYTRDNHVTMAVPADDPGSVASIELSNDGTSWTSFDYDGSVEWTLSSGGGSKTVRARWVNDEGKASMSVADSIVFDSVRPTTTGPQPGFAVGSVAMDGTVPVRLSWSGADATSGVARYELARSRDGGGYASVATTLTSGVSVRSLEGGHSYRFRVRAVDKAGNVGAWAYGRTFQIATAQESSPRITYSTGWQPTSGGAYWGDGARYANKAGAKAVITVTGRSFAWISALGPTRGTARVYVNGNLIATVNLNGSAGPAEIVWAASWSTAKTRTITIRVVGTVGHPRVDVDGFAWAT